MGVIGKGSSKRNERGRMAILPDLEDDEGAYGLTEDWNEVEWAYQQHDERRSATTRPVVALLRAYVENEEGPPGSWTEE